MADRWPRPPVLEDHKSRCSISTRSVRTVEAVEAEATPMMRVSRETARIRLATCTYDQYAANPTFVQFEGVASQLTPDRCLVGGLKKISADISYALARAFALSCDVPIFAACEDLRIHCVLRL